MNNRRDLSAADEQLSLEYVDHSAPAHWKGPEGAKRGMRLVYQAFPDHRLTIEDLIAEGDQVVARCTWHGTHLGAFRGIQASGEHVSFSGIVIWRIVDGLIVERWGVTDLYSLVRRYEKRACGAPLGGVEAHAQQRG